MNKRNDRTKNVINISEMARDHENQGIERVLNSIKVLSGTAKRSYSKDRKKYLKEIRGKNSMYLGAIDPLNNAFNFISFSKFNYYEPEWTQFIANCLKEKVSGRVIWKAICEAVCDAMDMRFDETGDAIEKSFWKNMLAKDKWNTLMECDPVNVKAEQRTMNGIPDITLNAGDCFITIENKIDAQQTGDQLQRYKKGVKDRRNAGFVYLTREERTKEAGKEGFVNITYESLGKKIRNQLLQNGLGQKAGYKGLIGIFPLLVLLNSIEKDLYEYSIDKDDVGELLLLAEYLHKEEHA